MERRIDWESRFAGKWDNRESRRLFFELIGEKRIKGGGKGIHGVQLSGKILKFLSKKWQNKKRKK